MRVGAYLQLEATQLLYKSVWWFHAGIYQVKLGEFETQEWEHKDDTCTCEIPTGASIKQFWPLHNIFCSSTVRKIMKITLVSDLNNKLNHNFLNLLQFDLSASFHLYSLTNWDFCKSLQDTYLSKIQNKKNTYKENKCKKFKGSEISKVFDFMFFVHWSFFQSFIIIFVKLHKYRLTRVRIVKGLKVQGLICLN